MKFPHLGKAAKAAAKAARRVLSRKPVLVKEEVRDARLRACEACPFFDAGLRQCNECTCFVDLKVELSTEECPKGRWLTPPPPPAP